MKKLLLTLGVLALTLPVMQAQDDDIYYNPKNDKSSTSRTSGKKTKKSYYIKDFSNMDVDEYNRASDMYYETPVDTIGAQAETDQDFVYTQQIQKYYNPTIVVDNASLLEDVLNNSYGNVEVVINNYGEPTFAPYYYDYYYPSRYYAWGPSWSWNWGPLSWRWNWGPSWTWTWGPSWTWTWGPSWSWNWGPSWAWGWGPGYYPCWGWGPGYYPCWGWSGGWSRPFYADRRPGSHRPTRPAGGWAHNTAPGYNHNGSYGRPGSSNVRGNGNVASANRQPTRVSGNRRGYTQTATSQQPSRLDRPGNNVSANRAEISRRINRRAEELGLSSRSNRNDRTGAAGNRIQGNVNTNSGTSNRSYTTSSPRRYNNATTTTRTYNNGSSVNSNSNRSYNSNSNRSYNSTTNRSYNSNSNRSYNSNSNNSYNSNSNRSYNSNSNGSYNNSSSRSYNSGSSSRGYSGGGYSGGGYSGGGSRGGGHRR